MQQAKNILRDRPKAVYITIGGEGGKRERKKGRKKWSKQDAVFQDIRWEVLVTASGMHIFHPERGTVCVKTLATISKAIWYNVFSKDAGKDHEMRHWMGEHVLSDG